MVLAAQFPGRAKPLVAEQGKPTGGKGQRMADAAWGGPQAPAVSGSLTHPVR